jgi:hypothetical protein
MSNNSYDRRASFILMEDQTTAYVSWKLAISNQDFFATEIKEQLGNIPIHL